MDQEGMGMETQTRKLKKYFLKVLKNHQGGMVMEKPQKFQLDSATVMVAAMNL
jgi:hypothetical protein